MGVQGAHQHVEFLSKSVEELCVPIVPNSKENYLPTLELKQEGDCH